LNFTFGVLTIACVAAFVAVVWYTQRERPLSDERLDYYLKLLLKPGQEGKRRGSTGFRTTTATITKEEHYQIRKLMPPQLIAAWEEKQTALDNHFSVRALSLAQVMRRKASNPTYQYTADDLAVLWREGVQQEPEKKQSEN